MTESGRKFIETYKKESQALAEREAEAAGGNKEGVAEVNIAKIKDEPAENEGKDGGDKDIVSNTFDYNNRAFLFSMNIVIFCICHIIRFIW